MATPKSRDPAPEAALLSSWKDIAAYFGKGVRTVQRWEREFDLPVRRTKQVSGKSAVIAVAAEIDAWVQTRAIHTKEDRPYMAELRQLRRLVAELQAEILELRRQVEAGRCSK